MASKSTNRRINIYVNDNDAGKSIKAIKKEARQLNYVIENKLTPGTKEYEKAVKRWKELDGTIKNHKKELRGLSTALDKNKKTALSLPEVFKRAFAITFIASFVKMLVSAGFQALKLRSEIKKLTGVTGRELNKATATVAALSKAFGETSDRISIAANRMSREFGISLTDALSNVENGLLAIGTAEGRAEFLDNIDEYSNQFKDLNYNANEFSEILVKQSQTAYKDFGADFLKEFNIKFTSEKEKLVGNLEDINKEVENTFSKELVNNIKNGETGSREALEQIIKELDKLPPKSAAYQKAVNSIFGTKGEDVSEEFIRSLSDVDGNVSKLIDTTDALTIAQQNQLNLQKNLETVKLRLADAMKSRVLPAFANLVGLASDYVQVPLSKQLQEEQIQLNSLVTKITDTNISQSQRNKLIGELQKEYPNFLGNLNAETVTNEQLGTRLREVNAMYIQKIILQKEEEKVQKALEKAGARANKVANDKATINRLLNESNVLLGGTIDLTNSSLEENTKKMLDALKVRAEFAESARTGVATPLNQEAKLLFKIGKLHGNLANSTRRATAATDELSKAQQNKNDVMAAANIDMEEMEQYFRNIAESANNAAGGVNNFSSSLSNPVATPAAAADTATQEKEELQAHLERIRHLVQDYRQQLDIDQLDADAQAEARIIAKYGKEIAIYKAVALKNAAIRKQVNDQIAELEKLRDEEISQLRTARKEEELNEEIAAIEQKIDKEIELELSRQARKAEIEQQIQFEVMSAQERELTQLDTHYQRLIDLANQYGINTTALEEKWRKKKIELEKRHQEEVKETTDAEEKKLLQQRTEKLQAYSQAFGAMGDAVFDVLDAIGAKQEEAEQAQKLFTLAKIAMDTAAAISSLTAASEANPANAITAGGAGIAQFVTGLARVFSNIAMAKKVLSEKPANVGQQKADGGYSDVIAPDGKTYNAQYIGRPQGGMLPPGEKLILANERGSEYFIPNHLLNNPLVADYVSMIEGIRVGRQFEQGGFVKAEAPTAQPTPLMPQGGGAAGLTKEDIEYLISAVNRLNQNLENGVNAVLEDDFLLNAQNRLNSINKLNS